MRGEIRRRFMRGLRAWWRVRIIPAATNGFEAGIGGLGVMAEFGIILSIVEVYAQGFDKSSKKVTGDERCAQFRATS